MSVPPPIDSDLKLSEIFLLVFMLRGKQRGIILAAARSDAIPAANMGFAGDKWTSVGVVSD